MGSSEHVTNLGLQYTDIIFYGSILFILVVANNPNPSIGEFLIVNPSGKGLYIVLYQVVSYPFVKMVGGIIHNWRKISTIINW